MLKIRTFEDPVLRTPVELVTPDTKFLVEGELLNLSTFVNLMNEIMNNNNGIGLAAPQVGFSYSLFVVDVQISSGKHFKETFINPKLIDKYGHIYRMEEGCLSFPGIHQNVDRYGSILLHYDDINFKRQHQFFHGIESRVIQHEYDHLQGILFTDYAKI